MKLRVFKEPPADAEPEVFLRLDDNGDGSVDVVACLADGSLISGGTLLTISKNGVHLSPRVNEELGIELGIKDRLKVNG